MYSAPGIGLAAVQVGILKRLIVIDISKEKDKKNPLFLINPEIISKSKNTSIMKKGVYLYQVITQKLRDQQNVK